MGLFEKLCEGGRLKCNDEILILDEKVFTEFNLEKVWENLKKLWKHSPISLYSNSISYSPKLSLSVSNCLIFVTLSLKCWLFLTDFAFPCTGLGCR